jgi:hypothetical protein
MKKISKIKESSKNIIGLNQMMPEGSIDADKSNGWGIKMQVGPNESVAYGVGESIMKPQNVEESSNMFTINRQKDYKNRVRKTDKERRQRAMTNHQVAEILEKTGIEMGQLEEAHKTMIQGHQGATQESKSPLRGEDSIATFRKSNEHNVEDVTPKSSFVKIE